MSKRDKRATDNQHEGLPHRELRDLIAVEDRNPHAFIGVETRAGVRESLVAAQDKARAALEAFDRGTGFTSILSSFRWCIWDVSDHVHYDPAVYHNFVGTRTELEDKWPEAAAQLGGDE